MAVKWVTGGCSIQCKYTGRRGDSHTKWNSVRSHPAIQKGTKLKKREFFVSGILH